MCISAYESIIIFKFLSLSGALNAAPRRSFRTPETNIAVVRTRKNILIIWSELGGKYPAMEQ
jgi:hypothetical protein